MIFSSDFMTLSFTSWLFPWFSKSSIYTWDQLQFLQWESLSPIKYLVEFYTLYPKQTIYSSWITKKPPIFLTSELIFYETQSSLTIIFSPERTFRFQTNPNGSAAFSLPTFRLVTNRNGWQSIRDKWYIIKCEEGIGPHTIHYWNTLNIRN